MFTHDERLPDAVRHLQIPATVIEVTRRPGSIVEVRTVKSPIERYFDDAMAIVRTENLTPDIQRRVVPGFCRSGVEAACAEAFRRRRLKAGAMHQAIEADLDSADSLRKRLALAFFDDIERTGDVARRLAGMGGADQVMKALNEGTHGDYDGDLELLARDAERLAAQVGALVTSGELASAARALMATGHDLTGIWPRAALLGRQALEQALDDLWGAVAPRVREASRHAQLLCLDAFVRHDELVTGVRHAWHG
ncbi:MAG: hypothetical protein R2712_12235 [Vicinamibacterales bacterium]